MMEKGYSLEFKNNCCVIFDNNGVELFGVKMKNKSFIVDWIGANAYAGEDLSQSHSTLWHKRFRHFNNWSLNKLSRQNLV